MYKYLKEVVYEANIELNRQGLVLYTFGNVSQVDRQKGVIAIKPSGVQYDRLKVKDIVIIDFSNNVVEGRLKPSSDTKTHTCLYKHFPTIEGVAHTHSTYATAWAQAKRSIPCYGTTHADYVFGEIPCTEVMTESQVQRDYEEETGNQIIEKMKGKNSDETSMILVAGHAPFTWGKDAAEAVYHAAILEEVAKIAYFTQSLDPELKSLPSALIDKHYQRKHGVGAYYGQAISRDAV